MNLQNLRMPQHKFKKFGLWFLTRCIKIFHQFFWCKNSTSIWAQPNFCIWTNLIILGCFHTSFTYWQNGICQWKFWNIFSIYYYETTQFKLWPIHTAGDYLNKYKFTLPDYVFTRVSTFLAKCFLKRFFQDFALYLLLCTI